MAVSCGTLAYVAPEAALGGQFFQGKFMAGDLVLTGTFGCGSKWKT